MGWSFMYDTSYDKKRLVKYLVSPERLGKHFRVLKHAVVGNNLWTAIEVTHPDKPVSRFIGLDLLRSGGKDSGWGYKDLCESQGLFEADCPQSILDLVPEPPGSQASRGWRDEVRIYHEVSRRLAKGLGPGLVVDLGGQPYTLKTRLGRKGWLVERQGDGKVFRATCAQVSGPLRRLVTANVKAEEADSKVKAEAVVAAPEPVQQSMQLAA